MSDKLLLEGAAASVFQPRLAAWIGINESILLQHVHYLANKEGFGATVDGIKWVRMTTEEWAEELPCFDAHTIRRTLANLEGDNLLIAQTFSGRSKWYRVNYEVLQGVGEPVERLQNRTKARAKANAKAKEAKHNVIVQNGHIGGATVQNGQSHLSKMDTSSVQNGQLPRPLSENKLSKDNSGKKPLNVPRASEKSQGDKTSPRWQLMNEFLSYSGLKLPYRRSDEKFWWSSIGELYELFDRDIDIGKKMIRQAIDELRRDKMRVSGPESLIKTARDLLAQKNHKPRIVLK